MANTDSDFDCLAALIEDEQSLEELSRMADTFNIFEVLKSAEHELKHSNVIAWLLSPSGSHLLGRRFFDSFVRRLAAATTQQDFLAKAYADVDSDVEVFTEHMNIDILIVVEQSKVVIAIENKIWSKEHDRQLSRYRETLEKSYRNEDGWSRYYFFLTPDGDLSTEDADHWNAISYQEVLDAIKDATSKMDAANQARQLIQHYCMVLERKIMNQSDVEVLCQKIYRRHTKALNLIFDMIGGRNVSPLQTLIEQVFLKLEQQGDIIVCKDKGHYVKPAFHTQAVDEFLGRTENGRLGSWGNDYLYVFWIERRDPTKLKLYFEVGPKDANERELKKINAIISALGGRTRTETDTYCRIWSYKTTFDSHKEGVSFEKLSAWIEKGVKEILDHQNGWLETARRSMAN